MTPKDYIAIADAFAGALPSRVRQDDGSESPQLRQWREDRDAMADLLERDHPSFDRDRFVEVSEERGVTCRGMADFGHRSDCPWRTAPCDCAVPRPLDPYMAMIGRYER